MTSERPDTSLNPLISGGMNYEWLRSQVIVSNESVAHSRAFFSQGLNADCLDRLNSCVITELSRGLIFQPTHTQAHTQP